MIPIPKQCCVLLTDHGATQDAKCNMLTRPPSWFFGHMETASDVGHIEFQENLNITMYTTDVSTHTQSSLARIQGGKSDPSNPIKPNKTTQGQGHTRRETPVYRMDLQSQYNISSGPRSMNNECYTCSNYPLHSICLSRRESRRTGGKPTHWVQSNRLKHTWGNFIPTERLFSRGRRVRIACVGVNTQTRDTMQAHTRFTTKHTLALLADTVKSKAYLTFRHRASFI